MNHIALGIFILTYLGIIFTRLPFINLDRPSAAFFGSVAMLLFGVLSFDEAIRAIDFNTIALLLGMMIIISTLELDGFFSWLSQKTISYSKTQTRLLMIIVGITGIASAFLVNDAVVLLFTPVVIRICRSSRLNPIPYLIAEILASNIGSAMSMTGNPQNMLIGISSGLSYSRFLITLAPVSLAGMGLIIIIMRCLYPENFRRALPIRFELPEPGYQYQSMRFSVPIFLLVIGLFFPAHRIGLSIPMIALLGASMILILGRIKPSRIIQAVDWVLLLFFSSLFIVVRGFEKAGWMELFKDWTVFSPDWTGLGILHGFSLIMSQIVSNVPFTILVLPVMKELHSEILWLGLASASTLAGNATIIGAMANLIVIESAHREGIRIGFWEFFRSGIVVTVGSIGFSILWLYFLI